MVKSILKVKVNIPPLGTKLLARPRILERLAHDLTENENFARQLSLISAPAGFGKTTLARQWLAGREGQSAWYSLDEGDNEPERFWLYFIAALQTQSSKVGNGTLALVRSEALSSQDVGEYLIPLLNDLFELETPLFLVLDDYHHVNNPRIHQDMRFFIENLPSTLHLVVTTRSDPPWPMARWRSKRRMAEIRLEDLKFAEVEAGHLFAQIRGQQLTDLQLSNLYKKTEGWITGLQLAASSLATSQDPDEYIKSFAGSHRHVLHFLSEEVFTKQPEPVQTFLLWTSILNRFNAPLCEEVTGREDSAAMLAKLERENMFVVPLDEQGIWYRYHSLFADLLLLQLKKNYPDDVLGLHQRAASWFVCSGRPGEAVRHAIASKNLDTVAEILHEHFEVILRSEGAALTNQFLNSLPSQLLKAHPRLAAHKAFNRMLRAGRDEARDSLELAEEASYEDTDKQQEYDGILAAVRTYYYIYNHDYPQAIKSAEQALQLLPPRNSYWRMSVAVFSGDAHLFAGNPKGAYPYYLKGHASSQKLNNSFFYLTTGFKVATSLYYLGRLREAEELTRKLLGIARDEGLSRASRVGLLWPLLGELLREKGDLPEAERCVERGLYANQPEKPSLGWNYLASAAVAFSRGEYQKALLAVKEIEGLDRDYDLPTFITAPAAAWKARIFLVLGDMAGAREALAQAGVTAETLVRGQERGQERGYLVLALLLAATGDEGLARELLERIEELTTQGDNKRLLLETWLAKAGLEEKAGRLEATESCLLYALQTGMEAGYYQVLLDEGNKLTAVLARILAQSTMDKTFGDYIRTIVRGIIPADDYRTGGEATAREESSCQGLVEELNQRELEILGLVSKGLSNQEVSERLFMSLGTVKWYTSNIYSKLGVKNRAQAIIRAQELELL